MNDKAQTITVWILSIIAVIEAIAVIILIFNKYL